MQLETKITNNNALVGVVGLGYVGLPLVLALNDAKFKVVGIDNDQEKIEQLKKGKSYISHIQPDAIIKLNTSGFHATSDFSIIKEVDVIILCVPTPLNQNREPDLSYIKNTYESLQPFLRKGQMIVIESTTYPGMTDEVIARKISSLGFEIGRDIFVVYSPEREDPGNKDYSTRNIPKIVGGYTETCLKMGVALYSQITDQVVEVSSLEVAEMTKLIENIQRAVNIGLMNEMKIISTKMGIDIHEVINAAKTKPFGFMPYYPGPGIGGHCIPVDPFYLTWKAREFGLNTKFIELAGEMNLAMPVWVVSVLTDQLNQREKPLKNSKILILGIAYKKNIDDMRQSPAVMIMKTLKDNGAIIDYSDPYIPVFPQLRHFDFNLESVSIQENTIRNYDAVLLITDHDDFDYEMIIENANILIDTRGVYKTPRENLTRA